MLLSGQGADELFAGYRRHRIAPLVGRLRLGRLGTTFARPMLRLPSGRLSSEYATRLARASGEPDAFRAYMQLCTYSTPVERAMVLDCNESEVSNDVVWKRHREVFDRLPPGLSFLCKALALDVAVYLPGLGLAYVDRAGMEFGVPIDPFDDGDLELVASPPRAVQVDQLGLERAVQRLGHRVGTSRQLHPMTMAGAGPFG